MQTANINQAKRQARDIPFAVVMGATLHRASAQPENSPSNDDTDLAIPTPVPPIQPMQPDSGTELVDSNPITPPR
jgi:hypothetical protein